MARKIFYFVRHGESILNSKGIRQGSLGGLSEKGKLQAESTGKRFENRRIDIILASPFDRTKETAEIINKYVKKKIEFSILLAERRNPTEIIGKSMKDENIARIVDIIDKSFHEDTFRYSDEENFEDLKRRAKQALDFLSNRKEKFVIVATHGIFLRMIVAYIVEGEKLTASLYNKLSFLNGSSNASITICQYKKGWFGPKPEDRWSLIAWDDFSMGDASIASKTI